MNDNTEGDDVWYEPLGDANIYDVLLTFDRRVVFVAPYTESLARALVMFVDAAASAADPDAAFRVCVWSDAHTLVAAWPAAYHAHMLVHGHTSPLDILLTLRHCLRSVPVVVSHQPSITPLRSLTLQQGASAVSLAIATLLRQEPVRRVRVWVDHHLRHGADLVWIYDNGSSDAYRRALVDELQAHVACKRVQLIRWPFPYVRDESGMSAQTTQQTHAIHALRGRAEWLALIDVDEFLLPMGSHTAISSSLAQYDSDVAVVHVSCVWFGCNHGATWTDDNFLQRLTRRSRCPSGSDRDKLLVRPALTDLVCVHRPVDVRGRIVCADPWRTLRFNHYYTLSQHRRHLCRCRVLDACLDTRLKNT